MNQKESTSKNKKAIIGLVVIFGIIFLIVVVSFSGSSEQPKESFSSLARARFDSILKDLPEVETISCVDGDCSSVAYFDFKTIPTDLETIIRGNAATFSKFKLEKTGVSHVNVTARVDGRELLSCRASSGTVTECK